MNDPENSRVPPGRIAFYAVAAVLQETRHFNPSFFPASSRSIDSRMRFSRVSLSLAV